jgi:Uncharacterised nucleotidyltransferase
MEPCRVQLVHQLLQQKLNWSYVMEEATRQVIRPVLYQSLRALQTDSLPKEVLSSLHEYYCNNAARNQLLANELVRLLERFEQSGISAVPYKGPLLAAAAYGNLSAREFADLDIFVRKQDVLTAKEILIAEGYRLLTSQKLEGFYLKHKYHFPFQHPETNILVEIHWAFTKRYWFFDLEEDNLWSRLMPFTLWGANVLSFSAEDSLLILCIHGGKHRWARLAWICDVAELIGAQKGLDWESVLRQAKKIGGLRVLFIGLRMTCDLLETSLPVKVLERMNLDKASGLIASNLQKQIFSGARESDPDSYFFETRERLRDKTQVLLHDLRVSLDPIIRHVQGK